MGEAERQGATWPGRLTVTLKEAAQSLGVAVSTFHDWLAAGKIPDRLSVKIGKRRLFKAREMERWIEAGCPSGEGRGRR